MSGDQGEVGVLGPGFSSDLGSGPVFVQYEAIVHDPLFLEVVGLSHELSATIFLELLG